MIYKYPLFLCIIILNLIHALIIISYLIIKNVKILSIIDIGYSRESLIISNENQLIYNLYAIIQ